MMGTNLLNKQTLNTKCEFIEHSGQSFSRQNDKKNIINVTFPLHLQYVHEEKNKS